MPAKGNTKDTPTALYLLPHDRPEMLMNAFVTKIMDGVKIGGI